MLDTQDIEEDEIFAIYGSGVKSVDDVLMCFKKTGETLYGDYEEKLFYSPEVMAV